MKNDQYRRYKDAARALGADESPEALKRVLAKLVPPKTAPRLSAKRKRRPSKESPR